MKILFRSAGGLGNQIFQLLFTRLLADALEVSHISHYHQYNYSRKAFWEYPESINFLFINRYEKLILKLRLPQAFFRLKLISREYLIIKSSYVLIDGYFQDLNCYKPFSDSLIFNKIQQIKIEILGPVEVSKEEDSIIHLRLGDFFSSKEERRTFVLNSLNEIEPGSAVISNQDELFMIGGEFHDLMTYREINYIPTKQYCGLDLIRLMSKYKTIISNGSTLALWASILSNAKFCLNKFDQKLEQNSWMLAFSQKFTNLKVIN